MQIRTTFWPRRSFGRSIKYFVKRVLRLTASPHAVAAGVAAGVFASWTPFLGFHFIVAVVLAYLLAGNLVASAIGTGFGNPITFPFIWGGTHKLGKFILGDRFHPSDHKFNLMQQLRHADFDQLWEPLIKPMAIGAIPLGILCALIFYVLTYWGVSVFQNRRRFLVRRK